MRPLITCNYIRSSSLALFEDLTRYEYMWKRVQVNVNHKPERNGP